MRVIEVTEQMGGAQFEDVVDRGVQTLRGALEIFDQKSWEPESKAAERITRDTQCAEINRQKIEGVSPSFGKA